MVVADLDAKSFHRTQVFWELFSHHLLCIALTLINRPNTIFAVRVSSSCLESPNTVKDTDDH